MIVSKLFIQNFKKFKKQEFHFNPLFNLIIGENGSGKTSILDALDILSSEMYSSIPCRPIYKEEIRKFPVVLTADFHFDQSISLSLKKTATRFTTSIKNPSEYVPRGEGVRRPIYKREPKNTSIYELENLFRTRWGALPSPHANSILFAIKSCIPNMKEIWFDSDNLMCKLNKEKQLVRNLSSSYTRVIRLVADIALSILDINLPFYDPSEVGKLLRETEGLVLIDELDAYLHPNWQFQIISDLRKTFSSIQFICTSNSPQMIGELQPLEVMLLSDDKPYSPRRTFGLDVNSILEEILRSRCRNQEIEKRLKRISKLVSEEKLDIARDKVNDLALILGENNPDVIRTSTLITFLTETSDF
jgi:predicted ATP-binding protein involved in virulence